jgi:hypothetical protein
MAQPERIAAPETKAREGALSTFKYAGMVEENADVFRRTASTRRVSNLTRNQGVFQELTRR